MHCSPSHAPVLRPVGLLDTLLAEEIPPGHVRIRTKAVGICGSDVHYLTHVRRGLSFLEPTMHPHSLGVMPARKPVGLVG